ncbi:YxeA family protein [Bacillus thuringiensis]|uniref:YxeA family protein n=1 Tax=Bacillus cereus group TaxID=86661 RepID=UPI00115AF4AA
MGTETYYIQITTNGEPQKEQEFTRCKYKLQRFNEKGKAKELEFTRENEIKKGVFMKVFMIRIKMCKVWTK